MRQLFVSDFLVRTQERGNPRRRATELKAGMGMYVLATVIQRASNTIYEGRGRQLTGQQIMESELNVGVIGSRSATPTNNGVIYLQTPAELAWSDIPMHPDTVHSIHSQSVPLSGKGVRGKVRDYDLNTDCRFTSLPGYRVRTVV